MKSLLRKTYGFGKRVIVPELKYSQQVFEEVLEETVPEDSKWLDLGCGHHLLPPWRLEEEKKLVSRAKDIVGIDYDSPSLNKHKTIKKIVQGTITELPFPNSYFDIATANMVVEHLSNPEEQFSEINRVLSTNGLFIFHTVNENGYFAVLRKMISGKMARRLAAFLDERVSEDVFEVHYKVNTRKKVEDLARETGFEVEKIKLISSDAVFALLPPLSFVELIYLRILMRKSFENIRTNMIVILKKK